MRCQPRCHPDDGAVGFSDTRRVSHAPVVPLLQCLRRARSIAAAAALLALLAACGGGGGGGSTPAPIVQPPPAADGSYTDVASYSAQPAAALPSAVEGAATTKQQITLNGSTIAYTTTTGHLIATDRASGQPEASFFYVAYTADNANAATRPVTFFYNGGPGSATVWLHLGSFGPKRLATGVPATTAATPFPLVDNESSLLDTSDLVFVNAVGTGLSEAIAPFNNQSFWGVDKDAAVFRDFVLRYIAANGRQASPKFLFGESYGGPRTAVLAHLLESAGVALTGLVLQSPALDYNSNCAGSPQISCAGYLPSYGAVGFSFALVTPPPADLASFVVQLRDLTATRYGPAVAAVLQGGAAPADLPPLLATDTGIAASLWQSQFNLDPDVFRSRLLPNTLIGRYDGRMAAPVGSALASEGDPSSTFITSSFASAINSHLRNDLHYSTGSTYVLLSVAANSWDYAHDGRPLPDTVPDLGAALAQNPQLRVLAMSGYDDLATPFNQTERDLARLGANPRIHVRNYVGGHMTYLDDRSRPLQKADLVAFYNATLAALAARRAAIGEAR
jgi:carboxypeptidase C (cathepsin A)